MLQGALQGGGARNLRMDNLGRAIAAALLRMEIEVSPEEFAEAGAAARTAGGQIDPYVTDF